MFDHHPMPTRRGRGSWKRAHVRVAVTGVLALGLPAAWAVPATATATPFQYREFSQGANIAFSPNCPFGSWVPSRDTFCDTYTVWYIRLGQVVDGGSIDRSSADFHAELDHEVDLVHADGTGDAVSFEYGISPVAGSYDAQHLTFARMDAVTMSMRDVDLDTGAETRNGRTMSLGAFNWSAASGTYEWGNDGPVFAAGPRHLATRCLTLNRLAHQKDTVGYVSGSLDGVPIGSFYQDVQIPGLRPADATGYIFDNWFHIDRVTRCFG
jgi:hypothetical protein